MSYETMGQHLEENRHGDRCTDTWTTLALAVGTNAKEAEGQVMCLDGPSEPVHKRQNLKWLR